MVVGRMTLQLSLARVQMYGLVAVSPVAVISSNCYFVSVCRGLAPQRLCRARKLLLGAKETDQTPLCCVIDAIIHFSDILL